MRKLIGSVAFVGVALAGFAAQADPMVLPKTYLTTGRIEVTPFLGLVTNDPWTDGYIPGVSVAYHLTSTTAIEVAAGFGIYQDKELIAEVVRRANRPPKLVSRPTYFATGNLEWAPLYGKFNLMGELVLRYRLFLLAGGGLAGDEITVTKIDSTNAVATSVLTKVFPVVDFGVGQQFFINRNWAIRFDIRPYIFLEFIDGQLDPNGDTQFAFGVTYML